MRTLAKAVLLAGVLGLTVLSSRADVIDDVGSLQGVIDESLLDLHGNRWSSEDEARIQAARTAFQPNLTDPAAKAIWDQPEDFSPANAAQSLGNVQARLQHVAALQMLAALSAGDIEKAREWRAIIKLPKYVSAVEGALALQRLGGEGIHREQVAQLLAKEYILWQITRAREKSDALYRLVLDGRATPQLIASRSAEIEQLSLIPPAILALVGAKPPTQAPEVTSAKLVAAAGEGSADLPKLISEWRLALEAGYPNLLSAEDVQRRERIVLKLLRLIPMEYQSGVRNGEIIIPLEYREAKTFTIQAGQIVNELMPVWRQTKAEALTQYGSTLLAGFEKLESGINRKVALSEIESDVKEISSLLQKEFGLALKKAGTGADVVTETVLEIRSLLGQSLAAAMDGQWRKAEQLRVDAYASFDLEIESRALPRDPQLAIKAEKTFLDGTPGQPGIKAALDSRAKGETLSGAYDHALDALDECAALVKVGLSPMAATISTILIVSREGLEAVVILAALLAGLRGPENAGIRRRIGLGAWLALGASAGLFAVSKTLLQGLSRYGETLEAVISVIAVVILLMVTNWVFHKYYWTGWNARLRDLSKAAQRKRATRWENLALMGVGFMTIFREGFETTLFMQSLILEAGMKAVSLGLLIGFLLIGTLGVAVFAIGAKLPYRKMLVVTGVLVIFVLFTFLGSTTRLFQTVGWLPVHPIPGLELPSWMGVWLGLYPTWEGILIPFATFAYVGGMWLFVKITARRAQAQAEEAGPDFRAAASH